MPINFQAYLKRIAYHGSLSPTLPTLRTLQKTHLLHVPFENLDIHLKHPIELVPEKVAKKIIEDQRGGFCYELNGLFYELLIHLGYKAKRVSGRVFNPEKELGQEFDHLAVIVNIEGEDYLTDVGFGEFVFHPLKIELGTVHNDERGDFVIDRYDDEYLVVSKIKDGEPDHEYIFSTIARDYQEFTRMCNYHQSSPQSHFSKKAMISIPTATGRKTLSGKTLKTTIFPGQGVEPGISEKNILERADYESVLQDNFGVHINAEYWEN